MKKSIYKILICCLVLCVCMAMAVPSALAAADDTYVVSFRPGEHGSFSEDAVSYLESFGTAKMSDSGNLFVEVKSGTAFPANILSYLTADEGYYYKDGLAGKKVTEDASYVAQYGILTGSGVMYTIKYVDSVSGAELAESYTGYANEGDVIPFAAKSVNGYDVDSAAKSVTVAQGAELSFLYTSNGTLDEIEYEYGEDTIITQTVTTPGTNTTPGTDTQTPDDNNTDNNGEVIDENETPLDNNGANGGEDAEQPDDNAPTEEIDENEVPLVPGSDINNGTEDGENGTNWGTVAVVSVIGIIAIIIIAVGTVLRKKKKS